MIDEVAKFVNVQILGRLGVCLVRSTSIEKLLTENHLLKQQVSQLRAIPEQQTQSGLANTWVLAKLDSGISIWADSKDVGVSRPCMMGIYEPDESGFVRSVLNSGDTFVDIGANIGWFTLMAANIVGPEGRVYSFEPRPDTSERLGMSADLNGYMNVEIQQVALGSAAGRMTVATQLSAHNPGGTWSLATDALDSALDEGYERFEVDVIRLDDLQLKHCDLLKIDIEGAEYLALSGATETLTRLRPTIISEINPEPLKLVSQVSAAEYVEFLRGLGYSAYEVTANGPGKLLSRDFATKLSDMVNIAFLPD